MTRRRILSTTAAGVLATGAIASLTFVGVGTAQAASVVPTPKSLGVATSNEGWRRQQSTDLRNCNPADASPIRTCNTTVWGIQKTKISGFGIVARRQEFLTVAGANAWLTTVKSDAKQVGLPMQPLTTENGIARYSVVGSQALARGLLMRQRTVLTVKAKIATFVQVYSMNAAFPNAATVAKISAAAVALR